MVFYKKIIKKGKSIDVMLSETPDFNTDISLYKELDRDLLPHEVKLHEIFNSIHIEESGELKYDILLKKAKVNGIIKKLVDEYVDLFLYSKFLIIIPTSKISQTNLSNEIIRKIELVSEKESFQKSVLEKVTRLYFIFKELNKSQIFRENFVIFGGTAINGIYTKWPRLSVDLDIQYVGDQNKEQIDSIREQVNKVLEDKFTLLNYELKSTRITGGTYSYKIKYVMKNGHTEDIKLDINFLNRVPILPLIKDKFYSPLGDEYFETLTFQKEELYAKKMLALTQRTASRDIFDVCNMVKINISIFVKVLTCTYILNRVDLQELKRFDLREKNLKDFQNQLRPTLRKNVNLKSDYLIIATQEKIEKVQRYITHKYLQFATNFNREKPNFEDLFEGDEFNEDINKSPLLETLRK